MVVDLAGDREIGKHGHFNGLTNLELTEGSRRREEMMIVALSDR